MNELNFDQFINMLDTISEDAEKEIEQGLNEIAEDLLNASQHLTPIDKGDLTANGSVDPARLEGDEIKSRVGYSKEYALRMHEDFYELGEQSKDKPVFDGMKVGRKYLERPSRKYGEKYAEYLASKVNGVFWWMN